MLPSKWLIIAFLPEIVVLLPLLAVVVLAVGGCSVSMTGAFAVSVTGVCRWTGEVAVGAVGVAVGVAAAAAVGVVVVVVVEKGVLVVGDVVSDKGGDIGMALVKT